MLVRDFIKRCLKCKPLNHHRFQLKIHFCLTLFAMQRYIISWNDKYRLISSYRVNEFPFMITLISANKLSQAFRLKLTQWCDWHQIWGNLTNKTKTTTPVQWVVIFHLLSVYLCNFKSISDWCCKAVFFLDSIAISFPIFTLPNIISNFPGERTQRDYFHWMEVSP